MNSQANNKELPACNNSKLMPDKAVNPSKQDLLAEYLVRGLSIKEAGIKAGYAPTTAATSLYPIVRKPEFRQKMLDLCSTKDILNIPSLQVVESQIISHLLENPLDYPKHEKMVKQIKQSAGYLAPDPQTGQGNQTINIQGVQNLMLQLQGQANSNPMENDSED